MSIKEILALGALAFPLLSYAQSKDSLTFTQDSTDMTSMKRSSVVPYIIPMSLMSYGTAEAIVMSYAALYLDAAQERRITVHVSPENGLVFR